MAEWEDLCDAVNVNIPYMIVVTGHTDKPRFDVLLVLDRALELARKGFSRAENPRQDAREEWFRRCGPRSGIKAGREHRG